MGEKAERETEAGPRQGRARKEARKRSTCPSLARTSRREARIPEHASEEKHFCPYSLMQAASPYTEGRRRRGQRERGKEGGAPPKQGGSEDGAKRARARGLSRGQDRDWLPSSALELARALWPVHSGSRHVFSTGDGTMGRWDDGGGRRKREAMTAQGKGEQGALLGLLHA